MPQKKHKAEEIVAKLRQVDVLLSQGRTVGEAVRIGVTHAGWLRGPRTKQHRFGKNLQGQLQARARC
jgi:hypothetical protein